MYQTANPEMLILAREIRGMTQTELAEISGIDQGRISRYEGNLKPIPDDELNTLAKVLSFPVAFFCRDGKRRASETSEIFHRKRRTLSATQQKRIDGLLNLYRFCTDDLLNSFDQLSPYSIPQYDVDVCGGDVEYIAAAVRVTWGIPSGPIDNLVQRLEAASCMIFSYDFGIDQMDEATQWVEPAPPIILVNSRAPGDRLRFNLAHALGHLVMHHNQIPYPKMEDEADQFASAFLMPSEDIRPELAPVTIDHMLSLKPSWKVSMQALIRRARDLGEISDRQYTSLFQMLSRYGYRKQEPFAVPVERPEQVRKLLKLYKDQLGYSDALLADLLKLTIKDFVSWFYADTSDLTIVENPKRSSVG